MRTALAISTLMHAAVIVFAILGLPHLFDPDEFVAPPVVVEVVDIDEIRRAPEAVKPAPIPKIAKSKEEAPKQEEPERATPPPPKPKPEPKPVAKELKPKPVPKPKPIPPKDEKVAALPPPKEEVAPVPLTPPKPIPLQERQPPPTPPTPTERDKEEAPLIFNEPKVTPPPKPAPEKPRAEEKEQTFAAVPTPKKKPKRAEPKPAPEKPQKTAPAPAPKRKKFDIANIRAKLNKTQNRKRSARGPKDSRSTARARSSAPAAIGQKLTMTELDAIQHQIERNWSVPAGARDAEKLVVWVKIYLNRDGTLQRKPELIRQPLRQSTMYVAAARSALRAVLLSEPLRNLPAAKYEHWREIEIRFDPQDIAGG